MAGISNKDGSKYGPVAIQLVKDKSIEKRKEGKADRQTDRERKRETSGYSIEERDLQPNNPIQTRIDKMLRIDSATLATSLDNITRLKSSYLLPKSCIVKYVYARQKLL